MSQQPDLAVLVSRAWLLRRGIEGGQYRHKGDALHCSVYQDADMGYQANPKRFHGGSSSNEQDRARRDEMGS